MLTTILLKLSLMKREGSLEKTNTLNKRSQIELKKIIIQTNIHLLIDKIFKEEKDPGASLGPGPKAGPDGVTDSAYTKQFKYKLVPKNKDGTYVQKGSGMVVKKLF